jgi:hypothetical protein
MITRFLFCCLSALEVQGSTQGLLSLFLVSFCFPRYLQWLWCDYHAKVTDWFLTLTDRLEHPLFYSSFINAANRSWSTYARDADHKRLQPLDYLFIDCLAEEPIPADMLIEALSGFNRSIGGTKGYLKGKGLIQCENTVPG